MPLKLKLNDFPSQEKVDDEPQMKGFREVELLHANDHQH